MKRSFYQALHDWVLACPRRKRAVIVSEKLLPAMVYVGYPAMLVVLLLQRNPRLIRAILVPAIGFLTATVLRSGFNRPRPYEEMGIPSITRKDTQGKSFPSRHAACAAVIAVTALRILPGFGILLCILSVLIAGSRVLSGVHYVRDVVAGLLLGGSIGWIGMFVIP